MTSRTLLIASLLIAIVWTSYLSLQPEASSAPTSAKAASPTPAASETRAQATEERPPLPWAANASSPNNTAESPTTQAHTGMSPIDRIRAIQNKTALHQSLLKDHDEHHRYPAHNRRFERPESDPVLRHYGIDQRVTTSDDDQYALSVASDQKYYLPSQNVTLLATLQDAYGKYLHANFAAQLIYNEQRNLGFIDFSDSDQDGRYESTFSLADFAGQALPPGLYKVLIMEETSALVDAVAFVVSEPVIQATGEFRESLTAQGDLRIELEVEVKEQNRFYVQASLYALGNTPVGTTQFSETLAAGTHWVPLDFYGLMIRDSGEAGPYTLQHLSLAKVGVPMERMPLSDLNYQTQSYGLDQFTGKKYEEVLSQTM